MAEVFFIKTEGGPHPGVRVTDDTQFPWPLPGFLPDRGGRYVKVAESTAPSQAEGSRLIRAARYRWFTDAEIEEAGSATAQD